MARRRSSVSTTGAISGAPTLRNSAMVEGVSVAGFEDESLWEETKEERT